MPLNDIRPFASEHGGHDRVQNFRMGALTTDTGEDTGWLRGYIMIVDAGVGDINAGNDAAIDPATGLSGYIATSDSAGLIAANKATSGAATFLIPVPVYSMYGGAEFVTRNVYNNSDTNLGPSTGTGDGTMTGVFVGVSCDLHVDDSTATMIGHDHGIDINGNYFTITRILDANGQDSWRTGATADQIVFRRQI